MSVKPLKKLDDLKKAIQQAERNKSLVEMEVRVCAGPGCLARGGRTIYDNLVKQIDKNKSKLKQKNLEVGVKFEAKCTGCHGLCEAGPLVIFEPSKLFYTKVKPEHTEAIVKETILEDKVIDSLLFNQDEVAGGDAIQRYSDIRFYALQNRVALKNVGVVDPLNFNDYLANGGMKAFLKALEMKPEEVINEIELSGLRGRGGAGFSTGKKWRSALKAKKDRVWLICNGDEGDPGAFMDRAIMEGDPYSVIEGMMIASHALGATEAYIYVRHEYPLAVKHLRMAIDDLSTRGLLGGNILGSGMDFSIKISRGGGAFVCGESSALMRSLEGKVGEPRAKYVRSVEKGLHDEPTVLNNVETFTCIPQIISKGGEWFASMGRENSTGTKAFSLVGKVKNTGLVEVQMGRSLKEIIFDIGGGMLNDRPFKAVQTGGPSGGCLPASKLDLPVDFDTLTREGAMMGSGGMIVMDDKTCMVDVAKYFINFLVGESCGKCVPCREGLRQSYNLLDRITRGEGSLDDLDKIDKLCHTMEVASLCALGKSAPFPVISTMKYFREEYEQHIREKKCVAGICRPLITYEINRDCIGCMLCKKRCPTKAISGENKKIHLIDQEACITCGICYDVCPVDTIDIISGGAVVNRRLDPAAV